MSAIRPPIPALLCAVLSCALFLGGCQPAGTPHLSEKTAQPLVQTGTNANDQQGNKTATALPYGLPAGKALFLVQTDAASYHILDIDNQTDMPYDFPAGNQQYDLATGISPNRTQMILPINDSEVVVFKLSTGEIHTTYILESDSPIFQLEQAVSVVKEDLPVLAYSDQGLVMALEDAYRQSKMNVRWFRDEGYRLSVLDGSPTSTCLTLDNHRQGTREQLETKPGLVENYWVEPGGERILLKKGYLFEPGAWQDDQYYLIDADLGTVSDVPLPASIDNPLLFWFSPGMIGIIHQPGLLGGTDFSIMNAVTLESNLVVGGSFTGINTFGSNVLSYHHDQDNQTTLFRLQTYDGNIIGTQTIGGLCSMKAAVHENLILINCSEKSYLIQERPFTISAFGDPFQIVAQSPDFRWVAALFADGSAVLFSEGLGDAKPLPLQKTPEEIRWLPDSSGFLYRAMDHLYHYDLASQENHLLLSSNFFFDYRHLNGVWVQSQDH